MAESIETQLQGNLGNVVFRFAAWWHRQYGKSKKGELELSIDSLWHREKDKKRIY